MSDEIHFSRLRLMARSPAHYRAHVDEDSPARRFGSCVHVLALGGEVIRFEGERTGNAWKGFRALVDGAEYFVFDGPHQGTAWKWAKADAGERAIVTSADVELAMVARELQAARREAGRYALPIVTSSEYSVAARVAEAVRSHPIARELLEGETERPLEWPVLGRACAGQLDVLASTRVVDLKTSTKTEPEWFRRHAIGMRYHAQLEWYRAGAVACGYPIEECFVVAVETRPPYAVTCLRLTERALEAGAKTVRLWMERLLACEQADEWPAYVQSIVDLDVEDDFGLLF